MANKKISELSDGGAIAGTELLEAVQSGSNVKLSTSILKAYFQTLPVGVQLIFCGNMDLTSNVVPTTGGTGTAGAIKAGNIFYISVGSNVLTGPDGGPILAGYIAFARVDTPGASLADKTKWILIQTIV